METQSVTIRLSRDLIDKMDAMRRRQPYEPTRTQVIEEALKRHVEEAKRK